MEAINHIEAITKKQLAILMNVSSTTLRFYLNNDWYEDLKNLGYNKSKKVLSPRQVLYIESQWGDFDFSLLHMGLSHKL
jgi:predicted transcriptional regulator